MNDDITTETFHDQRPTHQQRPAEYQAAIDAADAAWQEYQAYIDIVFSGEMVSVSQEQRNGLLERLQLATAAEDAKEAAYREWMTAGFDATRAEPGEHIRHMVMA